MAPMETNLVLESSKKYMSEEAKCLQVDMQAVCATFPYEEIEKITSITLKL